jgi:Tol biopolymer transport system component
MRPDGTHKRQLTQSVGRARFALNYDPDFSPNGKRILFTRQRHSFNAIRTWVMRSDGSNPHPVPRNRRHGGVGAVFSPNGKRISYVDTSSSEIMVMRADGSHSRQLTNSNAEVGSPSWGVKPR